MASTSTKAKSLYQYLPEPEDKKWGVCLHLADGYSDKEYRLMLDGTTVLYQWGRRGAAGQYKTQTFATSEQALNALQKQWAAKEAKGYWPETGVVPLGDDVNGAKIYGGAGVTSVIQNAYVDAVKRLWAARSGHQLWLCQAPPAHCPMAPWKELTRLAREGDLCGPESDVKPGSYFVVRVGEKAEAALQAVCPVAAKLGKITDSEVAGVAMVAKSFWEDYSARQNPRQALQEAMDIAQLTMA